MDYSPLLFPLALGIFGLFFKAWVLRQDMPTRIYACLGLFSIAMWLFGFALYGACHGEVDFLRDPFKCSHDRSVAFNPNAWRVPPR